MGFWQGTGPLEGDELLCSGANPGNLGPGSTSARGETSPGGGVPYPPRLWGPICLLHWSQRAWQS